MREIEIIGEQKKVDACCDEPKNEEKIKVLIIWQKKLLFRHLKITKTLSSSHILLEEKQMFWENTVKDLV